MNTDEKKTAAVFKAFCDENRIRILKLLKSGEKCACRLLEELNVTQPTLSHHMKILCDSGVVIGRKEGKWTHYSISPEGAAYAAKCLRELTSINGAAVEGIPADGVPADGFIIDGIPADGHCGETPCR